MSAIPASSDITEVIETTPIRDLVERYPDVMPVLAEYGFDLCCGGGHTVPEAAQLHGIDVEPLVARVTGVIRGERG